MARMTPDEWRKKKEEEKKQGTISSSATSTLSSETTASGESSGRMTPSEWKEKKASTSLEWWAKSSIGLLNKAHNKSQNWSYKDEHSAYSSEASNLLAKADSWRKQYADNKEVLTYIDSVVDALSDFKQQGWQIKDFYSQWKTQEEYDFWGNHNTLENRQQWHSEQSSRLEELKAEREAENARWREVDPIEMGAESVEYQTAAHEHTQKLKAIDEEIAAIETEITNYERGNYNEKGQYYGTKVEDDYYSEVAMRDDFPEASANRDFGNATRLDYDKYYYQTYGGTMYDERGNVAETSLPGYSDVDIESLAINDPLGFYLDSMNTLGGGNIRYEANWVAPKEYEQLIVDGTRGSWAELDDTEVGIYYVILNEQGYDAAMKYLSDMEPVLNKRETMAKNERNAELYNEGSLAWKVAMNAASVPAAFYGSALGFLDNAANTLKGEEINPYSPAHSGMHYKQTVRGETAEDLDETGFKIPVVDFTLGDIYQTGMSRLDSALATAVFGGGGTVFLGMGAANEEAYRLYEQGASAEQITLGALAAGAAEAVFEYVSFDKLVKMDSADTIWKWVKNALVQGGIEASEEAATEAANIITNAVVMGKQSDLAALYEENGNDWFKTGVSLVKQTLHSAFGGFLSGGAAGGLQGSGDLINIIATNAEQNAQYRNTGRTIMGVDGGVDALKTLANEVAGVSDGKMQKSLTKQARNVSSETATGKNFVGKVVAKAKNSSNATKVGKLYNTTMDATIAQNNADIAKSMDRFVNDIAVGTIAKKYTEKAFTPEGKYKVSDTGEATALETEVDVDGKTITKDTGEVIDIKGVASIHVDPDTKKVVMLLDVGDGKTINAENVAYANKNDALIYEAIANLGENINAEKANKLIGKYTGGDAMVFARGMAQAYSYGFYGIDRSELTGKHTLATELTEEQRNFAYGLGEQYRPTKDLADKAQAQKDLAKSGKTPSEKGVFYRDKDGNATDISTYLKESGIKLNDTQKTGIEAMRKLSAALGVRFNVFESWVENGKRYYLDENGVKTEGNPNGFYDTTTGEIYIDLNAGNDYQGTILFTVAHELTHFMRQWSPEHFTKIASIVFKHGGMKGNVSELIALKQAKAKKKGKPISYDTAMEEVVADGMETILKDGKVVEFMSEVKQKDRVAWEKIKGWFKNLAKFLRKMVWAYRGQSAQTVEGQKVADFAENLLRQIEQIWAEGAVSSGENYQVAIGNVKISNQITMAEDVIDSSNTGISKQAKTGIKMQERTEFEAQPKQVFRVSTANGKAESKMLGTNKSVKELRDANFKENGFSKEEIDKINGFIKDMADNMAKYRLKYKFVGLQNIHDAKIILDPMSGKIVLSAMVNNSDYSVNFDFTKICKKRVALQEVLETLAREKGKVTDGKVTEVNLSPANIKRINDILASYGVETACLCCFVESKRYNIQNYYQEKVVDVWNKLVNEVAPDADYFNFADSDVDTSKIPDSEFADLEMQMKEWAGKTGKAKDVEQKMREFLADSPAARKKLRFSDLVTANGRTNLHKLYPEIESLILSKLGQSAPKSVEAFTPYNGEIDLLEATNNGDIVKYLYSIAGVRSQSFSDFMIAHVFDVLQKTASMSARKMPAHVYTKEIARAMLFGMTGEKHNLSVLHNVDPNVDSWSAGLSKDGEYNFSDYEAYKKGYSEFVQSIGWKDAVKLQNTEGYSKDCGIIGVGFSYNHMLKLHNDPEVRQVIGYHTSQMPVEVKPLTHLDKAADYTAVQNTKAFVGFAKPNYAIPEGVPSYATPPQDVTYKGSKTKKVADTFDIIGTFNKLSKGKTGDARTAAAKETLRQLLEYANDHGYVITTASGEAGKGEFDLYGDVQKTQNPYLTTDHYIEYCIERGMLPMFFEFSMNPNYYKDIFDFNVFDRKSYNPETGLHEDSEGRKAYAPQTAVHMLNEDGSLAFPENFFDIVDKQMSNYNRYMQDVDSKMPSIMDEVRAVTNSTTKMSDRDTRKVLYQDRINELTEEDVYRLIENSNHGKYPLYTFVPVRRDTPPLLVELSKKEGLPPVKNLPIIMNVEHIQQCMDEEVAADDGKRGHALTTDNIIQIVKGLDDPRYVFFQKDNKRYCEIVEYDVGYKGEKAMAIVTYTGNKNQDLMNGFPGREYNILVTAYPPDAKYWRDYQKSSNNVLIYDKTKDAPQGSFGSHVPTLLSGSPFATKVTQPDAEVKSKVDRDSLTPDQQKHFDYNQKQKTVGSALKTLKGSTIKRSTKFGVGKEIGGEIYFHKDYAEDILPDEVLSQAQQLLEEEQPGFEYNCLKYNPKTGVVAFQEAPDFDSAREPVVGDYVSANTNTGVVKTGHSNYIWHHKWNWVKNDYSGFDVAESWNWSKQWLSTLTEVSDGNGIERWNAQLDKFGLPHDGVMFSEREQEYDSKDTSVKILPATFTKFGLKSTDRVLDWGGGQYDIAKKAVELGYPGIKFEVVDAFNRTKSHNDRILAEYAENPATVLTINNVLNVIKETEIIEDVIRESKEYLAEDGVCYIKIYEGNETDGKTGNGKVTSSGWQNNQPAVWYKPFAEKYYQYVEPVGDILVASDKPINKKELPKTDKATAKTMRDKVAEIRKAEPSMRESLYSDRDNDYLDAIKRGDMVTVQRMVDEAAKKAGYTARVFHGTSKFGFTKADVTQSDDGISFFVSDNFDVSASYIPYYEDNEAYDRVREIGKPPKEKGKVLTAKSSVDDLLDFLRKRYPDQYADSHIIKENERTKYIEHYVSDAARYARELLQYSVPQNVEDLANSVIDAETDRSKWNALANSYKEFKGIHEITYNGSYFSQASDVWYTLQDRIRLLDLYANGELAIVRGIPESKETLFYHYEEATQGENVGIYGLYGKEDGQLVIRGRGSNWNNIPLGEIISDFNDWWTNVKGHEPSDNGLYTRGNTRNIAEFAKYRGYRSVAFEDIYDTGHYGYQSELSSVYAYFYPQEDIKSADPVTYDDNGNIIPLSERFNQANDDIRYSERVSNQELSEMGETALYIKNTDKANYIGMIFNGTKTEETRSRRTLDAFIGKDFYVTDGKRVYGSIVLGEPHKYTEAEFHNKENQLKHRVPKGDEYDIKPGGTKWAYPIESYSKFDKPKKLSDSTEYKNSFQAREVLYQDRDTESVSNRSLLANAFEGLAQTDTERNKIQEYKSKIALIDAEEKKLRELNAQIKELSFAEGPRDTKKISSLRFDATQAANRINTYDKQLLRLEASKPLQDVLAREKKRAYKKAEERGKKALAKQKEKAAKTQRALLEKWQDSRKKAVENREKTAMRHKVQRVVGELNQLLRSNDKKHHVPDSLKKAVADALSLVNMDTVGAEERAAKYAALIAKETDPDKIDAYTVTMENILRQGEKMGQRLKDLRDAYEEIQNSNDPDIANAYDPVIAASLKELADSIGNTSLRNMTLEQLSDVYDMYKMVLTRVRDANKTFINGRMETISSLASRVVGEVKKVGGKHKYRASILDFAKKFGWDNLKPVYAFEHIGSGTFTDVFNSVRTGEDVWAVDVSEAREYYLDKSKKHGYDSWDFKKKYHFKSASELDFELTLEQVLSLYAYSKREQAHDHLRLGGFVFDSNIETYKEEGSKLLKYKVNTADAHQITPEILANIISTLSEDQKSFVDEMQEYLSTVMGAKGNEVTMEMYGVKLFKEKFYFPLKSAKQFMFEQNEVSGEVKIKNSGFTNKVVPKANNPVILSNFMDVWAGHVNDMSMYHAFVLPLEDFNRVFNYNSPKQEGQPPVSVKGTIQNAYGPSAVGYVRQLITDLNGGARSDSTTGIINKLIGLFKKGSVFASLSVVVQQPAAIARATALVDTRYFIGPKVDHKRHKALWDEVKRYAPVAIIKEMGYFDTNMGKSTQDFIQGREYSSFKDKMKALVVDSDYRDEVLSKAPALADELAWCGIWEAVKRETKAKNPSMDVKSEAFLKKAGERFTEVITKTQVYDSILSRSGLMRSKDTGMKMATAFMAEPTTSINMVADALLQGKRGNKKYAATAIGAVIASQILNSILVSFVYAGRDDEEDETYVEKYIGTLSGEILDSLNPAEYIPFIKDIMSIVKGYDVERSDMAIVSDLWKAVENLKKDNVSVYRKVEGFAGSIAQIFGLPVKNIMRDARGIYQTIMSFVSGQKTTAAGIGYAVKSALPEWIGGGDVSNQNQLYEAYLSGDATQMARVKGRFKDQDAINNALRKALRENDPRIHEAAIAWNANDLDEYMRIAKNIIAEKHFGQDDVVMAIRSEANALAPDDETETQSKAKGLFTAEKFAEAIAQGDQAMANAIKTDIIATEQKNGKTQEEAEKSFVSSTKSELREMFVAGDISEEKVTATLKTYCQTDDDPMDDDDIYWLIRNWNYEKETGSSDGYAKYNDFHAAVETGKNLKAVIKEYTDNGVEAKTLASEITKHFKPLYKKMSNYERASIKGYLLNAYALLGYDRQKKSKDIDKWLED